MGRKRKYWVKGKWNDQELKAISEGETPKMYEYIYGSNDVPNQHKEAARRELIKRFKKERPAMTSHRVD